MEGRNSSFSAKISNIRAIKNAEIDLSGITVMCGVNGCGKSTISKLIYGFLNTDINFRTIVENKYFSKFLRFNDLLSAISHSGRDYLFPIGSNDSLLSKDLWEIVINKYESDYRIYEESGKTVTKLALNRYKKVFYEIVEKKIEIETLEELLKCIKESIISLITQINDNVDQRNISYLETFYTQLFEEKNKEWKYQFYEYGDTLVKGNFLEKQQSFSKVIYIDMTETILDNYYRPRYFGNQKFSNSFLQYLRIQDKDNLPDENLLKMFTQILDGTVSQNKMSPDYLFTTNSGDSYSLSQCATGIKSFAILELLCKNGHFGKNTLLIIDEPEVHLHPQWVIEYARILIAIYKLTGTKILLATHNPDFVSALKFISEKEKSDVCFYLGKKEEEKFVFNKLGTDIEPIFESFNIALDRMYEYSNLEIDSQ